ncbi:Membrane-associated kinase regulator [Melia azedarach]|uniref:Membrane-associated kinase regulator n=1 Tax=Melia azedarach TaxID=155640 RepID=A0ACC1XNV2_MELAZ|nr:Membrane-associated kinase regulator [Melia azedarach]
MEAFSLLKYWRGGGGGFLNSGGANGCGGGESGGGLRSTTTTTIVTAVTHHAAETDDDEDDDGPFFDLEFALQDEEEEEDDAKNDGTTDADENEENRNDDVSEDDGTDEEEREFNFTISSNSSGNDRTDPNLTLSPSDDLFFKGRLVPIEPSSLVFNSAEPNSKPPQFPVSLLKSATKFRVSMLGFKKSKQNASEKQESDKAPVAAANAVHDNTAPKLQQQLKQETEKEKQSKFFTVKFKVEEVPIVSLFTRDNNSSRKSQKQNVEDSAAPDEKKFSKDVMQKYLKKVKPLYIRVSKRYGEKLKFSGQLSLGSGTKSVQSTLPPAGQKTSPPKPTAEKSLPETEAGEIQVKSQKQANIPERLRVVCKHLGKSRSASSAVAAAPPQPVISRRDDSLLQQQDGIQSAILHCKRSFNASRDSESSMLPRSVSDPSHQKSAIDLSRKSSDEGKDGSFEP